MNRRLLMVGAIAVVLVAIAALFLWHILRDPHIAGSSIKGRPVTYWTRQLRAATFDVDVVGTLVTEKDKALPALIEQLSLRDSPVRDSVLGVWRHLPAGMRERFPEPVTAADLRAGAATALMLIYTNDILHAPTPSLSEARMLFPALTNALHDKDHVVRLWSAAVLSHLKVIAPQAIAACGDALQDPHRAVRANAVYALGHLASEDERAIPLLRLGLTDADPAVRARASKALEQLGPQPGADEPTHPQNLP